MSATLPDSFTTAGIDKEAFGQILDMDIDEEDEGPVDHSFSKSIVKDFFTQAEETFDKMDAAIEKKDLEELSKLGHFLKGSSATLGLIHLRDCCEKIQHFGARKAGELPGGEPMPDEAECLRRISGYVAEIKDNLPVVKDELNKFFNELGASE
ncbi:MAG: hypothetical protein M1814_005010 [Vezdaea aestivalis]|nr:MAG: hypothetical protein M1814_005010 [Vezdaea aestivalis]